MLKNRMSIRKISFTKNPVLKKRNSVVLIAEPRSILKTKNVNIADQDYKANKKRERLPTIRFLALFLACFILIGLIESIVFQKTGLIFLFAILLVFDILFLLNLYLEQYYKLFSPYDFQWSQGVFVCKHATFGALSTISKY